MSSVSTLENPTELVLRSLMDRGFRFIHPRDSRGDIVAVVGVRAHGAVLDIVRLDSEDNVTAMRMPGDEANVLAPKTVLWQQSGPMNVVVDSLLTLSDAEYEGGGPSHASLPPAKGCWVPTKPGREAWLAATA
ncbi:hypothetical protein D5S17_09900 [Pseudonocardiaceae bacterium YIM PH 21723]|nr:hypothetical protein D5S17_09900 [Pseudonocardiaceae bacterium YIM PH 21723]